LSYYMPRPQRDKCSYARQSVVYVVENKCFPPSGDGSYGKSLCLGEEGYDASSLSLR
jgi:hypothetical protein